MKIGLIVQARMNSTRVPNKVSLDFGGKFLLWHVVMGLKRVTAADQIILATGPQKNNRWVIDFAKQNKLDYFCHQAENDVLARFYFAAKKFNFDHIVRFCADNLFVAPSEIDNLIRTHLKNHNDYTKNSDNLHPDLKAEIFTFKALETAFLSAATVFEKEHVTPFIWKSHPQNFKIGESKMVTGLVKSHLSLCVDTVADIANVQKIVAKVFDGVHPISEQRLSSYLQKTK